MTKDPPPNCPTGHFCEGCLKWHDGMWCPTPRVPEFQPEPGWLDRVIDRCGSRVGVHITRPSSKRNGSLLYEPAHQEMA